MESFHFARGLEDPLSHKLVLGVGDVRYVNRETDLGWLDEYGADFRRGAIHFSLINSDIDVSGAVGLVISGKPEGLYVRVERHGLPRKDYFLPGTGLPGLINIERCDPDVYYP